jgi:hypothetical protein
MAVRDLPSVSNHAEVEDRRMSRKKTGHGAPPAAENVLTVGKPEDREPEGKTSLKQFAGSDSRTFNNVLLNTMLGTLWCPANLPQAAKDDRLRAAVMALGAFHPGDDIEGMIAAQAVAMHYAAMECFRRVVIPDQSAEVAARLRRGCGRTAPVSRAAWWRWLRRWTASAERAASRSYGWSTSRCRPAARPSWAR